MRTAIITSLLALSVAPVHGTPLFNLFNSFATNNPFASAINGFFPNRGGATSAATSAAVTTPASAATTTPAASAQTSVSLNGQKGAGGGRGGGGAPATTAAAAINTSFNPNMPTPQAPTAPAAFATGAAALTNKQQASSLASACSAWVSDTGVVSNFQNIGAGLALNANQFKSQASIALAAEKDELLHKAVIDQIIGLDPKISLANLTLTDGSFQSVINGLQDMTTNGPARVGDIAAINKVRCPQILPAIDTYCQVSAQFAAKQGVTIQTLAAVRPTVCQNGQFGQKRPQWGGGAFGRRRV